MNREYPCDIIKDLLPGYIDEILSEAGTEAVKAHLETCSVCRTNYEVMSKQQEEPEAGISPKEQAALDGFKKVRRRTKRLRLAVASATGLLVLCIVAVLVKVYGVGSLMVGGPVEITKTFYDEKTDALTLNGRLNLADFHVSRIDCKRSEDEEFVINVHVYVAENLPFIASKQEQETFSVTVPEAKGCKVYLAGPGYQRFEVYDWKDGHYEKLAELEEELYDKIPGLNREQDELDYLRGIERVDGQDGLLYSVTTMIGEDAYYWRAGDQLIMHGDFCTLDLEIWISLEKPYQIRVFDYRTGAYTEDLSVVGDRKKNAEPEELKWSE